MVRTLAYTISATLRSGQHALQHQAAVNHDVTNIQCLLICLHASLGLPVGNSRFQEFLQCTAGFLRREVQCTKCAAALASCGCQIVLFTTGRGTPFGTFVPTMKISTNTPLFEKKGNWIDFNAGVLAQGEPMADVSARFIDFVLAAASGVPVNNEKNGWREIAIFKSGVTL